jgi:hypothetical protein
MIPHQLHLKPSQVGKLKKGHQVQIGLDQMGATKGKHILFLDKPNAKKLLSSYKKGKGVRMKLTDAEYEECIKKGRGLDIEIQHDDYSSSEEEEEDKSKEKKSHGKSKMPRMVKGSPEALAFGKKMKALREAKKGKGACATEGAGLKEFGKDAVSNLLPIATSALGGVAGAMITKNPAGAMAGKRLGELAGKHISKAIVGRGGGAKLSKPYKKALAANYSGLEVPVRMSNEKVPAGAVDKRVKPSSEQMTLSPYQKTTSPAMNPFVPMTYAQEGGSGSGYGQGKPYSNIYGRGMKKMGVGLY